MSSSATRSPDIASRCLTQRTQRVAVRDDQHTCPRQQVRDDRVVPVRQQPRGHVAQRLSPRPGLRRDDCVAGIGKLGVPGAVSEPGRRGVVKPAPRHALPLAGLHQHLGLVPALQRAVVIGVQPPGPPDRDPVPVTLGQGEVRSADRPALHGGVHQARQQPVRSQQPARLFRFSLPSLGQRHVHPAGKQIPGVPLALTMTQQNQAVAATRRLPHARVPVRASATPTHVADRSSGRMAVQPLAATGTAGTGGRIMQAAIGLPLLAPSYCAPQRRRSLRCWPA